MLEKFKQLRDTHSFLIWGLYFFVCFLTAYLLAFVTTTLSPNLIIVNESARSVISTSIQIQATILAIVISLTLLAVEMTASKYSPRVIEIFRNDGLLFIFLISYIISIAVSSIFLSLIENPNFPLEITLWTLFLIFLAAILIFMFIPYLLSVLDLLNTENIIKKLAKQIHVDTIDPKKDPFQSIFDVIYGAIKINDFTTMSTGLVVAEEKFKEIIGKDPNNWQNDYIAFRFFDDFKRCGFLLIDRKEEKYAFEIITRLNTIGEWAFKEQNSHILGKLCSSVEEIANRACEYKMSSVIDHALNVLKETAEIIIIVPGLSQDEQITKKWSSTLFSYIESISSIGKTSIRCNLKVSFRKNIEILDNLGRNSIRQDLAFKDDFLFKKITLLANESLKENKPEFLNPSIQTLKGLGIYSVYQNHGKEALFVLEELKNIGKFAAEQKNGQIVQSIVNSIQDIAITAIERQMKDVERAAIRCSVKFQIFHKELLKNQKTSIETQSPDSISISEKEFEYDIQAEYAFLMERIQPPEDYGEWYDEDNIVITL